VWNPAPKIGFLAGARAAEAKLPALEQTLATAQASGDATAIAAATKALKSIRTVRFNNTVDAYVTAIFIILVGAIVILSIYEWMRLISRAKPSVLSETEPVFLPASALAESRALPVMGLAVLGFTMLKEISGEAAIDRAQACACAQAAAAGSEQPQTAKYRRQNAFLTATADRYNGVNRCC
jgi:carbon starvation protein